MTINQVSVFIGNRPGTLAKITRVLKAANVNIKALYVADTTDYGILRMVVDKTDEAVAALKAADLTVSTTKVLAVSLNDAPGGLRGISEIFAANDINIDYIYAFVTSRQSNEAMVVIRTHDAEEAAKIVVPLGVKVVSEKDLF